MARTWPPKQGMISVCPVPSLEPYLKTSMRPIPSGLLVLALSLAACGGSREADVASMPADTLIKPMAREPLTEVDLEGLSLADLALELPWTTNSVGRGAVEGAPAGTIHRAEVTGHAGFDRVVFLLDDAQPTPGYDIAVAPAGAPIACEGGSYQLTAEHSLVVTFRPARSGVESDVRLPLGVHRTGASRMGRAGVACEGGDVLVWVAELDGGDQVRILELRNPSRIAVDVR